jgi:hypothetical protein
MSLPRVSLVVFALLIGCARAGSTAGDEPDADGVINLGPDADPSRPDGSGGGGDPVDAAPPDAFVQGECTLVPQTGCQAGQACDLDDTELATAGTLCRNAGIGSDTSTCTTNTQCAAGYTCLGGSPTTSQCYEFCAGDSDCLLLQGGLCVIQIVYGDPPMDVPGVKVCSKACDPLVSSGCPTAFGCHVYQEESPGTRFFTHCLPSGGGGQEATCAADEDCQVNYSCVNTGLATNPIRCLKNCIVDPGGGVGTGCSGLAGTACVGFTNAPTINGNEYGVCWDGN